MDDEQIKDVLTEAEIGSLRALRDALRYDIDSGVGSIPAMVAKERTEPYSGPLELGVEVRGEVYSEGLVCRYALVYKIEPAE